MIFFFFYVDECGLGRQEKILDIYMRDAPVWCHAGNGKDGGRAEDMRKECRRLNFFLPCMPDCSVV